VPGQGEGGSGCEDDDEVGECEAVAVQHLRLAIYRRQICKRRSDPGELVGSTLKRAGSLLVSYAALEERGLVQDRGVHVQRPSERWCCHHHEGLINRLGMVSDPIPPRR
jgi:hypothetical protein